jgi:hypothetical protein
MKRMMGGAYETMGFRYFLSNVSLRCGQEGLRQREASPSHGERCSASGMTPYSRHSAACAYSVTGGHEHTRLRSPWTLSTRPTGHQYLSVREVPAGKQPSARE